MSENECNGLTTAKYLAAEDAVVQNPPREEGACASPDNATGQRRLFVSATLFSIVFALAAGIGLSYQVYLPVALKKASALWGDVAKPLAGVRGMRSPQTALQKMLIQNHADMMAEIQQRNKSNPINPHMEKLMREGWTQQDWNIGQGFQPPPFQPAPFQPAPFGARRPGK